MKKINIAELLKDCPKDMELDCTIYDNVVLEFVANVKEDTYPIKLKTKKGTPLSVTEYGCYDMCADAKCVIFPKGKTTWEGFVPPCQFKDGDIVTSVLQGVVQGTGIFDYEEQSEAWIHVCLNRDNYFFTDGYLGHVYYLRFATEEEKAKLFQAIKDNGYKWNAETKTLEKLPKFKVGDRVKSKISQYECTIADIRKDVYIMHYATDKFGYHVPFCDEDKFDLVPNKFDITTLKPFESRVLVRNADGDLWKPAIFGCYIKNKTVPYYALGGTCWLCCIPYEMNEYLLGTTDDCDKYFKTWK